MKVSASSLLRVAEEKKGAAGSTIVLNVARSDSARVLVVPDMRCQDRGRER